MKVNRTFLVIYDTLIVFAYILRICAVGPQLFGSHVLFYGSMVIIALVLYYLNVQSFFHPTAIEIVANCVNLIVAHHYYGDSKFQYDVEDLDWLTERFLESPEFEHFFYHEFNFSSSGQSHLKMKLTLLNETFNHTSIIIKTLDEKYIKFHVVKETEDSMIAFLYEWKIDKIEYTDSSAFERAKKGIV